MFLWIGANPITLYLADNLIGFERLARRFVGGDVRRVLESSLGQGTGDLAVAIVAIMLATALAWFLYRRKIFLRV
jgi:ABC-type Fe3+ transport system permease subunit